MEKGKHNSGLTAMARTKMSRPMAWLLNNGWLRGGSLLDYGCGRGTDVSILYDLDLRSPNFRYDPNHPYFNHKPTEKFDIITCHFVLNTVPNPDERIFIIYDMLDLLTWNGVLWISVRNDKKKLNGWTRRGTWQGYVEVPGELMSKDNSYRLYRLDKRTTFDTVLS